MSKIETDTQAEGGRAASSLAPCSEVSTHWLLEGQRKQDPRRWDVIGHNADTEDEACTEERGYREYMASEKTGWLDFRVVRVTTTREILPNASGEPDARRIPAPLGPKT